MSLDSDLLIDRRRLKRSLGLWRGVAVIAVLVALFVAFADETVTSALGRGQVARLTVEGVISNDRRVIEAIDRAGRDDSIRALLLVVDSPGGSVAGGEALHAALSRFRERKPVVALLTGTAASAGYMIALPAHRILARESTVTGSIGVILQSIEASELLARLGVSAEIIASGPLKDQPSPFHPLSEAGRAALRHVITDLYEQFVAMVAAGRNMPAERVRPLADGRVFTGREAVTNGLVDAIGGEAEARAWLAANREIPATTPVRDLPTRGAAEWLLNAAMTQALQVLFAEGLGSFRAVSRFGL